MSSLSRSFGTIDKTTKFQHIKTPAYYDDDVGSTVLVPFSYENNTLDIHIQNNVEIDLITNINPGDSSAQYLVQTMGGTGLVLNLGENMIRWLNNWVADRFNSSVIDTFTVEHPGVVTKVQFSPENNDVEGDTFGNDVDDYGFGITATKPSGEDHVQGDENSRYFTAWIFKSPLTIKFTVNGTPRYLTYQSTYGPED